MERYGLELGDGGYQRQRKGRCMYIYVDISHNTYKYWSNIFSLSTGCMQEYDQFQSQFRYVHTSEYILSVAYLIITLKCPCGCKINILEGQFWIQYPQTDFHVQSSQKIWEIQYLENCTTSLLEYMNLICIWASHVFPFSKWVNNLESWRVF